jgi:hypothetical protein
VGRRRHPGIPTISQKNAKWMGRGAVYVSH